MLETHRQIIDGMTQRYRANPAVLALIVIGSIARADAHEHSDVDAIAVLTDDAYARYQASGGSPLSAEELSGADGMETKAAIRHRAYLRTSAERGPEPTRYAFIRTIVPFSLDPEIERLLREIPVYPEHEREGKMASFASQVPVHLAYLRLGDYSEDPYLLTDTAHELALFGGRLILAHNRLLYPGRKHFLRQLERAPQKPDRFMWLLRRLLRQPCIPTAEAFCEAVLGFQSWPRPAEGTGARYVRDRDLAWLHGPPSLGES